MKKTTNMRAGFTMIELIFVIVIIGVLAAIAMNKLSATRDDAKITKAIANLKTCVGDMAARYTAQGKLVTADINASNACKVTNTENCFAVDTNSSTTNDTAIKVTYVGSSTTPGTWCPLAAQDATAKDLALDTGTKVKVHNFGGTTINRN